MVVKIIFSFIIISCFGMASPNSIILNKDTNSSVTLSVKELNDAINRAVSDKIATIHKEMVASQSKNSLDKNDVRDIFNDKFLNIMTSVQSEYKSAILGTNINMTYLGVFISLFAIFMGAVTYVSFKEQRKEIDKIIKVKLGKSTKERRKIVIKELKKSTEDMNDINYHQNILFYYINQIHATNLADIDNIDNKKLAKVYKEYNVLYEKIISITSLDKDTIVKTLPELNIVKFEQLKRSEPMQNYLKQIKEYFKDDSDLVSSIDKAIS